MIEYRNPIFESLRGFFALDISARQVKVQAIVCAAIDVELTKQEIQERRQMIRKLVKE